MLGNKYADIGIKPWRFSASDYRLMARDGFWSPGEGVELFDGSLYNLPAPSDEHRQVSSRLARLLSRGSGKPWQIRESKTLQLAEYTVFLPDFVLLKPRRYGSGTPTAADALVAIEIGDDSTLSSDLEDKLPRYAAAGIPELWIVELRHRRIGRYHQPSDDDYGFLNTFWQQDTIASVMLPTINVPVAAIIGPPPISVEGER
jgi:Uma2 family endonuclease